MHYLVILLGIVCVVGGFALTELKKNGSSICLGAFVMLGGLFLTFFGILNSLLPNFFM